MGVGDVMEEAKVIAELEAGKDDMVKRRLARSVHALFDPEIGVIFIHPEHFDQVMRGEPGPAVKVYFTSEVQPDCS